MRQHNMEQIIHHFSDNLYAKEALIPKGITICKHTHSFDHLSILAKGKALVGIDDEFIEMKGPICINVKAGKEHSVLALTNIVWYCIHATDEKDPSKIDHVLMEE
jgi:quercetin dioxygenase-like cupin family protein